MHISYRVATDMTSGEIDELYAYRYEVFVKNMGWQLPDATEGKEKDQFDHCNTFHVVARNNRDQICGCARLLPTTSPYLLQEVFPQLIPHSPPPSQGDIWEISRFTATDFSGSRSSAIWMSRAILAAAVECAMEHGATALVAVSPKGMERLMNRMGIHWLAVGPELCVDNHAIFANRIEIDRQTLTALGLPTPWMFIEKLFPAINTIKQRTNHVIQDGIALVT